MLEGTTGGVVATVPKENISNGVRTVENQVTLRYVPQTTAITTTSTTTTTTPFTTTSTTTTTVPAFKLGDVDGNGMIEVTDAVLVLTYYAKSAAGFLVMRGPRRSALFPYATLYRSDAVGILTYYARQAAGLPPTF
mgnify:CR=1 FL=1